jgi:hypothetical protein
MKHIVALLTVVCSAVPALADIRVDNPRINGRALDWCLTPARQCGRAAADRYCDMRRMGHAVSFRGQRSGEPTYILGTRETCTTQRFDHCDRFSVIVCSAVIID